MGGIEGANNVCAGDTAKIAALPDSPTGVTYTHQAVLAVDGTHPSSIIPDTDTREVQRPDGTKIADNYQAFAVRTANVDASVIPSTATAQDYWTGLQAGKGTFVVPPGTDCSNWGSEAMSGSGYTGTSQDVGSDRLGTRGTSSCNSMHHLLCVSH